MAYLIPIILIVLIITISPIIMVVAIHNKILVEDAIEFGLEYYAELDKSGQITPEVIRLRKRFREAFDELTEKQQEFVKVQVRINHKSKLWHTT